MLRTPFGKIDIKLNDMPINYQVEELPLCYDANYEKPLFIVDGRYKIVPFLDIDNMNFPIRLKCSVDCVPGLIDTERSGLETGERLFLNSLYCKNQKMSIGAFDELDGLESYSFSLTEIEIIITDKNSIKYAFFCVAWVTLTGDNYENNGDNYTWFAADPSLA